MKTTSFLKENYIAHRGYFNNTTICENSLPAFECAIKNGYAIELDIQPTKDNEIVVFHDSTLLRMTGQNGKVSDYTYNELQELNLLNTNQKIPTLQQVLKLVNGQTPLLIEIKPNNLKVGKLETKLLQLLNEYNGQYAIQSFNPFIILWFKKNAPNVVRGILSAKFTKNFENRPNVIKRIILKSMILNKFFTPDFIAYNVLDLPLKKIQTNKNKGIIILGWTVKSQQQYEKIKDYVDNIIFQDFKPQK